MEEFIAFFVALEWKVKMVYSDNPFFGFTKDDKKILLNIQVGTFENPVAKLSNHRRHPRETHVLLVTPNKPLTNVVLLESQDFWEATEAGVVNLKQIADKIKWKSRVEDTTLKTN